jgi:hypothetical protein
LNINLNFTPDEIVKRSPSPGTVPSSSSKPNNSFYSLAVTSRSINGSFLSNSTDSVNSAMLRGQTASFFQAPTTSNLPRKQSHSSTSLPLLRLPSSESELERQSQHSASNENLEHSSTSTNSRRSYPRRRRLFSLRRHAPTSPYLSPLLPRSRSSMSSISPSVTTPMSSQSSILSSQSSIDPMTAGTILAPNPLGSNDSLGSKTSVESEGSFGALTTGSNSASSSSDSLSRSSTRSRALSRLSNSAKSLRSLARRKSL